jgi:hypothetical protein
MRFFLIIAILIFKSPAFGQSGVIKEINCYTPVDSAVLTELFFTAYDRYKLTEEDYIPLIPEPKAVVSRKRNIPIKYLRDVVLALTYFPELQDSRIVFKYGKIKGTMNARPDILNIFRHPSNRKYLLIINSNQGEYRGVDLDSISVNARVGWFGHELSHIYTYYLMNNYQTLLFSLKYLTSQAYVRKAERYTNLLAISKGLTFPIYEGEKYVLQDMLISDYYKKRTIDRSLSLNEYKCLWFWTIVKSE